MTRKITLQQTDTAMASTLAQTFCAGVVTPLSSAEKAELKLRIAMAIAATDPTAQS